MGLDFSCEKIYLPLTQFTMGIRVCRLYLFYIPIQEKPMRYYESKDINDSVHHFANNSDIIDNNYCDNLRCFYDCFMWKH